MLSFTPGTDEVVVQADGIHPSCPNQQRVRRTGCTLVAVAATLYDESQIVLAGEIDGRHDIVGRLGGDSVGTWPRRPCVDPAEGLGQACFVADVVRILQLPEDLPARFTGRCVLACSQWRLHLDETTADLPVQLLPGRDGRPARITRTDAASGSTCRHEFRSGFG